MLALRPLSTTKAVNLAKGPNSLALGTDTPRDSVTSKRCPKGCIWTFRSSPRNGNRDLFGTKNCGMKVLMRRLIRRAAPILLATTAMIGVFIVAPSQTVVAKSTPFDALLGSWRGSGKIQLNSGMERLRCNAYYTGGGNQLGMAIRCKSESSNVEIRSKLSLSSGRITGSWEERTFNAAGKATGTARPGKISLRVTGGVTGSMIVSFTRSRQTVSISTQGIALKSVSISLTRS